MPQSIANRQWYSKWHSVITVKIISELDFHNGETTSDVVATIHDEYVWFQ
jgi:hypothetical protein